MSDQTLHQDDTWDGARSEGPGTVIGPYTLLRRIGEGGFGDVYEAEQSEPVKRRVALKIIKLGMDTREVIARFGLERQALAMMDHPHIARVFDAGATGNGRPYFVMEFVDGVPVSEYCDIRALPVDARLRLFEQVCAAVQHAHTKGVIHRDLKPGNILVGTHDDRPFAKVIDFGIAKATSGNLGDRTRATHVDQVMGTPLYMSPEQAMGSADIDTRTDIYSLGVILYELLTGTTPVEREKLLSVSLADTQRLICDVEPPRPSVRLLQTTTTRTNVAGARAIDSRRLARTIRGELDWIVMKALEKEPARRYETASALADDLRRYLAGEPVLAAPPSMSYRLRKFVRRNRTVVAAGALIAASLVAGIVAFAWQARIARARAAEAEQIATFEASMLGNANPVQAGRRLSADVRARYAEALSRAGIDGAGENSRIAAFDAEWQRINTTDTAREFIDSTILRPAVAQIDKSFANQPAVDAYLRQTLANRYVDMEMFAQAVPLQRSALATRRRLLGEDDPATLKSMFDMGVVLHKQGDLRGAETYYRDVLPRMRRVLGEDNADTLSVVSSLGVLYWTEGRLREAEPYFLEALASRRRVFGEDARDTLGSLLNTGILLRSEGKYAQAEAMLRESMDRTTLRFGAEDDIAIRSAANLGILYEHEGKLDQAAALYGKALQDARRGFGEENQTTLFTLIITGDLLSRQGKYAEAVKLMSPVEPVVQAAATGELQVWLGKFLLHLGQARAGVGNFAIAEPELLQAQAILDKSVDEIMLDDGREATAAIADFYAAWDRAEPGKGHATQAAEWKKRLATTGGGVAR